MSHFKKLTAFILCVAMLLSIFACGKEEAPETNQENDGKTAEESFNPYPYNDLSVFMTIPDYKNLTITQAKLDEMVNESIMSFVYNNNLYTQVFDRGVESGDKVIIDFVGMLDGVAFSGGTASDYPLIIGSNSFIDGFEDGIIGMLIGDAKDLNLKFPDNYNNAELAGKEVVFTVVLDEIWGTPEITDELCKEKTPYQTAAEYLAALEADCSFDYAWNTLMQQCNIKAYPDEYTEYYQGFVNYFNSMASNYSLTLQEFFDSYGNYFTNYGIYSGISTTDFYRVAENYAESNLVNDILMYYILRAEGITTSSPEYEAAKIKLETEYGMSYEELKESYDATEVIISTLNIALANKLAEYVTISNPVTE